MIIAKVVGNVWATRKQNYLDTYKLLIVQPIDCITGAPCDKPSIAVDKQIGAGIGDMVLVIDEGNSARQILGDKKAGIRTVIAGVIDQITVGNNTKKYH